MKTLAPVVVFAYRRPDHLRNTLTSLMRCEGFDESPVIVYCDGPRDASEVDSVMATREVARSMLGDRAEYNFSEVNLGLARSVIAGVSDAVDRFGRVIVVEDDLELSPAFLTFMNHALARYAHDERVFQISGYIFDVPELKAVPVALFLPFIGSWGWATWKRAWDQLDPLASGWEALCMGKDLRRRFNLDGSYGYATMLVRQMGGYLDSWGVRWYWSVFKANGLVLFPPVSLVSNTGFDGSGTHGRGRLRKLSKGGPVLPSSDIELPESVLLDMGLYAHVKKAIRLQNGGWLGKAVDKLRWWKAVYSCKYRVRSYTTVSSLAEHDAYRLTSHRTVPTIGWWSADTQQLTGQAIVTARVAALLERVGARDFSYRGNGLRSVASCAVSALRLIVATWRGRLNVLYLVCSRSNAGFVRDLPAYLSRFAGVRVIVHVHGSDVVDLCRRPWVGPCARALLARCELVVPSAHLLAPLRDLGMRHVHLCENFAEHADAQIQAAELPPPAVDSHPWRVLWNSNVMASKGFFAVAEAVRALADNGVPVRLVALGRPIGDEAMDQHDCCEALKRLEGQTWLDRPGLVDRSTAMRLLHEADIVCLPSHYISECQPLALIEAMCAARAVVIADTPALRATVGDYPCEVIAEQTPAAVKAALQHLLRSPPTEEALHAAAARSRNRFSARRFDRDISRLFGFEQLSDGVNTPGDVLDTAPQSMKSLSHLTP